MSPARPDGRVTYAELLASSMISPTRLAMLFQVIFRRDEPVPADDDAVTMKEVSAVALDVVLAGAVPSPDERTLTITSIWANFDNYALFEKLNKTVSIRDGRYLGQSDWDKYIVDLRTGRELQVDEEPKPAVVVVLDIVVIHGHLMDAIKSRRRPPEVTDGQD